MKFKIFVLLVIFSLTACGPSYYSILEPNDKDVFEDFGKQIVSKEDSTILLLMNFEEIDGDNSIFYTEISNLSKDTIDIDPAKFYFVSPWNGDSTKLAKRFLINPEQKIYEIEKDAKRRESLHNASVGLNLLGGLISIVAGVANDKPDVAFDGVVNTTGNIIEESIDFQEDKENLSDMKNFWKSEVLNKATLAPDEYCGGLMFFPFNEGFNNLTFVFPFKEREFNVKFVKRKIEINSKEDAYQKLNSEEAKEN